MTSLCLVGTIRGVWQQPLHILTFVDTFWQGKGIVLMTTHSWAWLTLVCLQSKRSIFMGAIITSLEYQVHVYSLGCAAVNREQLGKGVTIYSIIYGVTMMN